MNENIKELWGAWVKFPKTDGDIEFNYSSMEVAKYHEDDNVIEMRYPYFVSGVQSTKYFSERMLGHEFKITDEMKVFYSASKEKCVEWLQNKRASLLQSYKINYERLENSEIKEVEEGV